MNNEKMMARFWSKVDKNGSTVTHVDGLGPCWLWTAAASSAGYGRLRVGGRMISAHRLSYEIHNGPVLAGMCACHRCDVKLCVNPSHLFLGTHADNMRDRDAKGRLGAREGEWNGFAKLTDTNVLEIRKLYAKGGVFQKALAARFGVDQSHISEIVHRKTWAHV